MQTKTAAPSKADLRAADELDAMADQIDPAVSENTISTMDDLAFGRTVAQQGAARQLRKRAAELRQNPRARYM